MDIRNTRPKLVFFQYKYDKNLPEFLLIHKREHVKCLSVFFDVVLIHEDCDYQQICDKYQPDLALFESGVNHETCRRLKIENIRACQEIPKIALHNADGFCNARAGFLSDMDHWGIETFFAISTTACEHTPEIADNLFVWPVFADAEIYRDYGCWKSIPVLFTGNRNQFYPWRRKIFKLVSENYPSMICQHPGYGPRAGRANVMVGEDYARTINASWFVPACGTVAKEVVRKHFEIPASNACLITEKSPGLEAAGFVDMENCVFADGHDVLDKLDYLFQNPDVVNKITSAGFQLVHSRHVMTHRDQILQWFNLHKNLKSNQRIVQASPFEPLSVVQNESGIKTSHIVSNGLHLELLRQGDELLWRGNYEEAEHCYLSCVNYMKWMPEPKLRLALVNLYKGNAKRALSWIDEPIHFILYQYKAADPDPVEWAYFIITLLCLGKLDAALKHAGEFSWLHHPELDRARWASDIFRNNRITGPLPNDDRLKRRYSMHQLPGRGLKEWIEQLCIMLRACGQFDMAELLTKCLFSEDGAFKEIEDNIRPHSINISLKRKKGQYNYSVKTHTMLFLRKRIFFRKCGLLFRSWVSNILHRLEGKHGYFLPYYISESRNDEFCKAIRDLTGEEEFKTALVIGATTGESITEAFLTGALENKSKPLVFCISSSGRPYEKQKRTSAYNPAVKWYELSSLRPEELTAELEIAFEKISNDHQISSFEIVLIDSSELKGKLAGVGVLEKEMHRARFVLLDDINSPRNYYNYEVLCRDPSFFQVANNPGLRDGYAIFKRCSTEGELCG